MAPSTVAAMLRIEFGIRKVKLALRGLKKSILFTVIKYGAGFVWLRNPVGSRRVIIGMIIQKLRRVLEGRTPRIGVAYDLWSNSYDDQPGNLVWDMDEELFERFLALVDLRGKTVVDIGCGTGRHWPVLLASGPVSLTGYDVSRGMLDKLLSKFPQARVGLIGEDGIAPLFTGSVDIIVSTLALAHMPNPEPVLRNWARALKPGGCLLLTDFHPAALSHGAKRTFVHENRSFVARSFVHPLPEVSRLLISLGLEVLDSGERVVDESVRHYYEQKGALRAYEQSKGVPMVYGLLCIKK